MTPARAIVFYNSLSSIEGARFSAELFCGIYSLQAAVPGPEIIIEVSVSGLDEVFRVRFGMNDGEYCRAGAGHQGGLGVAAIQQPVLELG